MHHHNQQSQHSRSAQQMPAAAGSSDTNASSAAVRSLRLQQYSLLRAQRHINDLLRREDSRAADTTRPEYRLLKQEIRRKIDYLKCAAAAVAAAAGDQAGEAPATAASCSSSRSGTEEHGMGSSERLNSPPTRGSNRQRSYHHYPQNLCPRRVGELDLKDKRLKKANMRLDEEDDEEEKATCSDAFTEEEDDEENEDEAADQPGRLRDLDGATKQSQQQRHCCISSQTTIAIQLLSQAQGESSSSLLPAGTGSSGGSGSSGKPKAPMPEGAASWANGAGRKLAPALLEYRPPQFLLSAATWAAAASASEASTAAEATATPKSQLPRPLGGDTPHMAQKKAQYSAPELEQQQQQPQQSHHRTLVCPVQATAPVATARAHSMSAVQTFEPRTSTQTGTATETTPAVDNCSAPATIIRRRRSHVVMPPRPPHHPQQQPCSSSGSRKARQVPASVRRRRLQRHEHLHPQHTQQQQRCSKTAFLPTDSFSSSAPVTDRRHAIAQRLSRRLAACPVAQRLFQAIVIASATTQPVQVPLPRLFDSTLQVISTPTAFYQTVSAVPQPLELRHLSRWLPSTFVGLCLLQQIGKTASAAAQILPLRPLRLRQRASVCQHGQLSCCPCLPRPEIPPTTPPVLRSFQTGFRVLERLSLTARLLPSRSGSEGLRLSSALLQLLFYPEEVHLLESPPSATPTTPPASTVIVQANTATVGSAQSEAQQQLQRVCVARRVLAADRSDDSQSSASIHLNDDGEESDEDEDDWWRLGSIQDDTESEDDDDYEWREPSMGDANNTYCFVFDDDDVEVVKDDYDEEDFATSDF